MCRFRNNIKSFRNQRESAPLSQGFKASNKGGYAGLGITLRLEIASIWIDILFRDAVKSVVLLVQGLGCGLRYRVQGVGCGVMVPPTFNRVVNPHSPSLCQPAFAIALSALIRFALTPSSASPTIPTEVRPSTNNPLLLQSSWGWWW